MTKNLHELMTEGTPEERREMFEKAGRQASLDQKRMMNTCPNCGRGKDDAMASECKSEFHPYNRPQFRKCDEKLNELL